MSKRYPNKLERAFDDSMNYERKLKKEIEELKATIQLMAESLAFYRHQVTKEIVSVPELIERAKEK